MNELKIIKDIFPKSYNKIVEMYEFKSPTSSVTELDNPKLNEYINTNLKNLNIVTFIVPDENINAFTIPTSIVPTFISSVMSLPILYNFYALFYVYPKLYAANIDGYTDDKGVINFTHKLSSNTILNIYFTDKFYDILKDKPREFVGIMLHEVGHWYNVAPYFLKTISGMFIFVSSLLFIISHMPRQGYNRGEIALIVFPFLIFNGLVTHYIGSRNEVNCDAFVEKLGYGPDLAQALNLMMPKSERVKNQKELDYIVSGIFFKFKNFFHKLLVGYPIIADRLNKLSRGQFDKKSITHEDLLSLDFNHEFILELCNYDFSNQNINESVMEMIHNINFREMFKEADVFFAKYL